MFEGVLNTSMLWKAQRLGVVDFECIQLRDFGIGPRKQVDDTPYGGGDGMLLRPEPVVAAIESAKQKYPNSVVILPTPRGTEFKQYHAKLHAAEARDMIFVCARYEGYDERIVNYVDSQYCVGEYVLTGGELPTMTIIDSIVRLLPNVLGGETSAEKESFQDGTKTIEHPQYTRPENFRGKTVPGILLSGHHAEIEKWQKEQSRTQLISEKELY